MGRKLIERRAKYEYGEVCFSTIYHMMGSERWESSHPPGASKPPMAGQRVTKDINIW